jgi:diguanylate cyclase (GGDEF)-like protein
VTVVSPWTSHVDHSGDAAVRSYYESETARAVLPVSATLAVFYAGFALVHHVVLGQDPGPVVSVVAGVSALVATVVAIAAARHRIPVHRAHAVMALLVAMTASDAAVHLAITGDPQETVSFFILVVALGAALLRWSWFVPCAAGVWLAWLGAVVSVGGDAMTWWHWFFSMIAASFLGAVVLLLRRRSLDLAASTLRDAVRAATEDPATGLANRRGLELLSTELVALGRRSGEIVHCTFLDVDGLKTINDEQGHDTGDRVILAVAEAIRGTCRAGDVVARWGGDEFVVVGMGPSEPPHECESRVAAHLAAHHPDDPTLTRLSISVGRAELAPWDEGDTESLLWRADHDMYLRRAEQPAARRRAFLPDPVRWSEG